MTDDPLAPALAALDDCDAALAKLDASCCIPERSPRMAALAGVLRSARDGLRGAATDPAAAEFAIARLERAGGEIGRLQVTCCAPDRMPLYERMLGGLSVVQRTLAKAAGSAH